MQNNNNLFDKAWQIFMPHLVHKTYSALKCDIIIKNLQKKPKMDSGI